MVAPHSADFRETLRSKLLSSGALALALLALAWCGSTAPDGGAPVPSDPLSIGLAQEVAARQASASRSPRLEAFGNSIYESFDGERAMRTVIFADQFFRVRGNEGYRKTLDHLLAELLAAGFEQSAIRTLELGPERLSWTPVSASLELLAPQPTTLHAFADETGRDRATLLVGSRATPPTELEVVESTSGMPVRGKMVLCKGPPRSHFQRFVSEGGAAGILTNWLDDYHRPLEHPDVAQFGYLPRSLHDRSFGFSISPRALEKVRAAIASGGGRARVRVAIDVKTGRSHASTLEATIPGSDPDAPAIVFVAHVDEPGAHDNASGVAAQLELARALRDGIQSGKLTRPRHSLIFLWGQEIESSREWLKLTGREVVAALAFDMVGADPATTGAGFLVERMPDPGAVWLRPPDEPSGWGFQRLRESQVKGHFLTDYVLAAVRERGLVNPDWAFRDHPFEGGSDHEPFLEQGIAGLIAWHFPDPAYHTNLDRADRVSGESMRRYSSVMGAVALGLSSGSEEDVGEMLRAVEHGYDRRLGHVAESARSRRATGGSNALERQIAQAWIRWYVEALATVPTAGVPSLESEASRVRHRLGDAGEALLEQIGR